MKNFKLVIQYDGSRYKGWQRLGNTDNTIQGKIEAVLSKMVGDEIEIIGSSRTDAGVHALQQIANVKLPETFSAAEVKSYLNKYLPQDISVSDVSVAAERFHSRFHTKDKTYLYKIWNKDHPNPFLKSQSMHVIGALDLEKLKDAAQHFVGEHDFTAFSNAKSKKKSKVRHIYTIEIAQDKENGLIEIRIRGNGFLYNMVRKMVGTLIEVGLGNIDVNDIPRILTSKERNQTGMLADPAGLYLEKISF